MKTFNSKKLERQRRFNAWFDANFEWVTQAFDSLGRFLWFIANMAVIAYIGDLLYADYQETNFGWSNPLLWITSSKQFLTDGGLIRIGNHVISVLLIVSFLFFLVIVKKFKPFWAASAMLYVLEMHELNWFSFDWAHYLSINQTFFVGWLIGNVSIMPYVFNLIIVFPYKFRLATKRNLGFFMTVLFMFILWYYSGFQATDNFTGLVTNTLSVHLNEVYSWIITLLAALYFFPFEVRTPLPNSLSQKIFTKLDKIGRKNEST